MKRLNTRQLERGGSVFQTYVELRPDAAYRVELLWLTVDRRWIPYSEKRLGTRATARYRAVSAGRDERAAEDRRLHTI